MYNLKDKIVFVTGASSGIGAATARLAAASGAHVILAARRKDRLDDMASGLTTEFGARTHTIRMDVTNRGQVQEVIRGLPADWADIDVLVNNAGKALGLDKSYETTIEHLDGMFDTNVKGLLHVTQSILPGMLERERGHVVNIGSTAGHWVYPGGTVYCASKHAVRALNEGLKIDVHGTPIRVTSVDPGLVETEFSLVRFEGDAERAGTVYANMTPLTPEDVADAVMWATTRPAHVNISEVLLMCVDQSHATLVNRRD